MALELLWPLGEAFVGLCAKRNLGFNINLLRSMTSLVVFEFTIVSNYIIIFVFFFRKVTPG